jgi:serine/threonine protein kinase
MIVYKRMRNEGLFHCHCQLRISFNFYKRNNNKKYFFFLSIKGKVLLNNELKKQFLNEVCIRSRLNHVNLCNLVGYSEEPYCLLDEYSSSHTHLDIYLKENKLNNESKKIILLQITSAMKYLESLSICHRDLAIRNCLLDNNLHLKLSDIAICLPQYEPDYFRLNESILLPIRNMSPETLFDGIYTIKSDIWSFGILVWQLFTSPFKHCPFDNLTNQQFIYQLSTQKHLLIQTYLINLSNELKDLVEHCFIINTIKRPTFKELELKLFLLDLDKNDKLLNTHHTLSF